MNTLTFYTHPQSRGATVRWMLEECAADYTTVALPFGEAMKAPDYLAVNPMGKVPALKDGETVITETAAIVTYLAERCAAGRLIPPAGTPARGEYYRWLCVAIQFEYAVLDRWRGVADDAKWQQSQGYGTLDNAFTVLKQALARHDYLLGDTFGALDLYVTKLLHWAFCRAQVIAPDVICSAYLARTTARPAFKQAQALDAQLLAEMPA